MVTTGTFGFGSSYRNDLSSQLNGPTLTLYVRSYFTVPAHTVSGTVSLVMDYDSGFIAYINGREVSRANLGPTGAFAYCDQPAYNWHRAGTNETFVLGVASNLFRGGTNVLAVQVHGYTNISFAASVQLQVSTPTGSVILVSATNTPWRYHIGLYEPSGGIPMSAGTQTSLWGLEWTVAEFPDDTWGTGLAPLGYGETYIRTDLWSNLYAKAVSLYARVKFVVDEATARATNALQLEVGFDDGFVAYLNSSEIARSNLGAVGYVVPYSMQATAAREAYPPVVYNIGIASNLLRPGTNVLAVQVHNASIISSDLVLWAGLRMVGGPVLVPTNQVWSYFVGTNSPTSLGPRGDDDEAEEERDITEAKFADWIELYNDGSEPVLLNGWSLTDSRSSPRKWAFPGTVSIPAYGYLVVLCTGYNIRDPSAPALHTNFKLDSGGEYLALVDPSGTVVSEWAPYPPQSPFYSYGWSDADGAWRYFPIPTPGATNTGPTLPGIVPAPGFATAAGLYTNSIMVVITSALAGATIRYTVDGSEPDENWGQVYSGPIPLSTAATIRARAFWPGWIPSPVVSRSFWVNPPALLRDRPAVFIAGDWNQAIHKPNGVTAIVGGWWSGGVWRATNAVSDYNIPMKRGHPYERPVSVEFVYPVTNAGMTSVVYGTHAGLRLAGSTYTRPRYVLQNMSTGWYDHPHINKPQFNLYFREVYGLEPFTIELSPGRTLPTGYESLRLRGGKNDWDRPFIIDEFMRRTLADVGQVASQGTFASLYVNGIFRAYYNPVERYDINFFQRRFNSTNDWDIINQNGVDEGDLIALNAFMYQATNSNLAVLSNYVAICQQMDVVNFADYILVNAYGATGDWPHNNYYMARERRNGAQWRFFMWDAEGAIGGFGKLTNFDIICELKTNMNPNARAAILYRALEKSPEFRLLMADRIHRHFFNDGALTDSNIWQRFWRLKEEADPLLTYMRGSGIVGSYLSRFTNWFKDRPGHLFVHFRTNDVWPATGPPLFVRPPGPLTNGAVIQLVNTNAGGSIYYALDGADPRAPGGEVAGVLYTNGIVLDRSRHIRARVLSSSGEWSAVSEATFLSEQLPRLVITELYYHPPDNAPLEFVELYNADTNEVDLSGFMFTAGISFSFSTGRVSRLLPGEYVVVVQDLTAFAAAYNTNGMKIAGVYSGRLDNAGERLTLSHQYFGMIQSFTYDDDWYPHTDGAGFSLTLRQIWDDLGQWDRKQGWKPSSRYGGSPGGPDPNEVPLPGTVVINEILAHTDGSPVGDWIEIYNTLDTAVDLSGWWLSDTELQPFKYRIPDGTTLPAHGFVVFDTTNHFGAAAQGTNAFSLSEYGEQVVLSSALDSSGRPTGYREVVTFGPTEREFSIGRHVQSDGKIRYVYQRWPTPGTSNAGPRVGPLVFSEVQYAPDSNGVEFVEVYCLSPTNVPLYLASAPSFRWRFGGAGGFEFPSFTIATALQTFVICGTNPAVFRAMYGLPNGYPIYGPFTGRLDNAGDRIRFERPLEYVGTTGIYDVVEEVEYGATVPWPAVVGTGRSIRRIHLGSYGNDPTNWTAGAIGGTPNGRGAMESSAGDGLPDRWKTQWGLGLVDPIGAAQDSDGDGVPDRVEYITGTSPTDSNDVFRVQISLSNGWIVVTLPTRSASSAPGYEGLARRYALESAEGPGWPTNWVGEPGWTNLLGTGSPFHLQYRLGTDSVLRIHRARVWLQPE